MIINNIVEVNISQLVKTPKINRDLPHYLSLKEAQEILQLPTGNDEKAYTEIDLNYSFLAKLFSALSEQKKEKILQVLRNTRVLEKTG